MPKLVRFVLINSIVGIVLGWLIAAAMVHFNIGNLGELISHTDLATAVMLIPTSKDDFDKL